MLYEVITGRPVGPLQHPGLHRVRDTPGVGVTTGEPGYFLAAPVRSAGRVLGVVVLKVGLEAMEQADQLRRAFSKKREPEDLPEMEEAFRTQAEARGVPLPVIDRITSYNVCYTKLLRADQKSLLDLRQRLNPPAATRP